MRKKLDPNLKFQGGTFMPIQIVSVDPYVRPDQSGKISKIKYLFDKYNINWISPILIRLIYRSKHQNFRHKYFINKNYFYLDYWVSKKPN